eukprot:5652388-Amphidinium_carterae.1
MQINCTVPKFKLATNELYHKNSHFAMILVLTVRYTDRVPDPQAKESSSCIPESRKVSLLGSALCQPRVEFVCKRFMTQRCAGHKAILAL